ncbi:MAG TPA: hypothetical protein VI875_01730 [Candidatus Norongarragalinales archaeon]|nr:hypothetical protein [Candidatus Norongarragalinales archaeon]
MVNFIEDVLRKAGVGTFQNMPIPKEPDWSKRNQARGLGARMSPDVMWRVSTRRELVEHFKSVTKNTYKNLGISAVSLLGALYSFSLFAQSRDITFAALALVFAGLMSRHYTKAWGGYAGGWSDYEHDPVQMVTHNSYVLNKGWGLM